MHCCEIALHGLPVEVWPRVTYYNLSEDLVQHSEMAWVQLHLALQP